MAFQLTDHQWRIIAPILDRGSKETRGRKRVSDREILNCILDLIQLGGSWRRISRKNRALSFQTCHRRYSEWVNDGRLDLILETLAKDMEKETGVLLKSCFQDELYNLILSPDGFFISDGYAYYNNMSLPWSYKIRHFFESAWTWKVLLRSTSSWINKRLPKDLEERSNESDLQPYFSSNLF